MNGVVDESTRALLSVRVAAVKGAEKQTITAWIDTAFNGGLVIPRKIIQRLGLKQASTTQALLADGRVANLETFTCHVEWFGDEYRTQVVANDGEFSLLGTLLLAGRKLTIDFKAKTVVLD
ncbi:MAG: clan AA aspartic protease [Thermoguttaceae bacterium]